MTQKISLAFFLCALLWGCTGTDYITDPPMTMMVVPEPSLMITPDRAAVEIGQSQMLDVIYLDAMGMRITDVEIAWTVSDETIATVDAAGVVSGVREGQVNITAQVGDIVSEPVMVGVAADPDMVALVSIAETRIDLSPGESVQLSAQSVNARGATLERTYTWRSSDPEIATVDDAGQITAVAPGNATITAAVDGVTSNLVKLMVLGPGRTGMFVPMPGSSYACEGTATLQPSDAGGLEVVFGSDFRVSNGPRLEIILSTANMVGPGSINIGQLQNNTGTQIYPVPAGIEIDDFSWIIVHCVPFNITFGFAQIQ